MDKQDNLPINVHSSNVASENVIVAFGGRKGTKKCSLLRGDIAGRSMAAAGLLTLLDQHLFSL